MGPLAGPVVAAAVILPARLRLVGVDDSKRLTPEERTLAEARIRDVAVGIGLGIAAVEEIAKLNVYHAGLLAMRRAVENLPDPPGHVAVDARTIPGLDAPQTAVERGDSRSLAIAAASILAKTHRDRLMVELDARHPGYGFAAHKGYSTPAHAAAIRRLGPSPAHRPWAYVREAHGACSDLFYELLGLMEGEAPGALLATVRRRLDAHADALTTDEVRKLRLVLRRRLGRSRRRVRSSRA